MKTYIVYLEIHCQAEMVITAESKEEAMKEAEYDPLNANVFIDVEAEAKHAKEIK